MILVWVYVIYKDKAFISRLNDLLYETIKNYPKTFSQTSSKKKTHTKKQQKTTKKTNKASLGLKCKTVK